MGWNVDVITIRDIVYHSIDESLLSECTHRNVYRTASFDPMYLLNKLKKSFRLNTNKLYFNTNHTHKNKIKKFFPIDDKSGWLPFAINTGMKALLVNRYAAVIVTCGPFSSSLAAFYLAKKAKIPLIIDYRDHWTLNNTVTRSFAFNSIQRLENKLLKKADLILTATNIMKMDLVKSFGHDLSNKILPFYNGWDEADFINKECRRIPDGKIRISYLGSLYGERPLSYLLNALCDIQTELPQTDLELWMVGNFYPETHKEIELSGFRNKTVFIGQQQHSEAVQLMLDSDILLLIIGGEMNKWILTGKLFEYLRCRKPILTLAPVQSEAADILRSCGHKAICNMTDSPEIKHCLLSLINALQTGEYAYTIPYDYERSNQVRNLDAAIHAIPAIKKH